MQSVYSNNKQKIMTIKGMVSVIMPVYNTPIALLTAAVLSVLKQSYNNLELLIMDDGSEKILADECDKLATRDNRIQIFHNVNKGVSAVRNKGIAKSRGEYITFVDSDDTLAVNFLQVMVEQIDRADFVVCGCEHVERTAVGGISILKNALTSNGKKCMDYLCYMNPPYRHIETNSVWGKLFRKEQIGFLTFDENMVIAEDFKFNFEYIMKCTKGRYLDFCGYNYLERSGSLSRKYNVNMIHTIDVMRKMIRDSLNASAFDALISRSVNIAFTILMMLPDECKNERNQIVEFINEYRVQVLGNPLTKSKVKLAILTSYIGYGVTKKLFKLCRG